MSLLEERRASGTAFLYAFFWALGVNLVFVLALGGVSIPVGLGVFAYVYSRSKRANELLLWFRRFGEKREPTHFWFPNVLSRARSKLFVPITLQDQSFKRSYLEASQGGRAIYGLLVLNLFGTGGAMVGIFLAMDLNLGETGTMVLLTAGALAGMAATAFLAVRTGGVTRLKDLRHAERFMNRVFNRSGAYGGVCVVQCDDQIWKPAVEYPEHGARS